MFKMVNLAFFTLCETGIFPHPVRIPYSTTSGIICISKLILFPDLHNCLSTVWNLYPRVLIPRSVSKTQSTLIGSWVLEQYQARLMKSAYRASTVPMIGLWRPTKIKKKTQPSLHFLPLLKDRQVLRLKIISEFLPKKNLHILPRLQVRPQRM